MWRGARRALRCSPTSTVTSVSILADREVAGWLRPGSAEHARYLELLTTSLRELRFADSGTPLVRDILSGPGTYDDPRSGLKFKPETAFEKSMLSGTMDWDVTDTTAASPAVSVRHARLIINDDGSATLRCAPNANENVDVSRVNVVVN